jgi:hypothetical protein
MQHDAVERAVDVPVPDESLGEKVEIAMMLRPGHGAFYRCRFALTNRCAPSLANAAPGCPTVKANSRVPKNIALRSHNGEVAWEPFGTTRSDSDCERFA